MASFSEAVKQSIRDTNDLQIRSDRLATRMIREPDSVQLHDVIIAAQKAQLALDYTRTVVTRAAQAYQSLTNLR